MKLIVFLFISTIFQMLCAGDVFAWGPGVHTVIALAVLDDVSCILPSIAGVISSFPFEYLYGSLAADFFIGKSKKKNIRHLHNWEGGFRFLGNVSDDREASYAYGFLSHLAADVVAHNFFVPNLVRPYPAGKNMEHFYWEIKADHMIGPGFVKIARDILKMDHQRCDRLLKLLYGKRGNGLKTKKRLYAGSIRFSDYLFTTHDFFQTGRSIRGEAFFKYLAVMVDISLRLSINFLKNPATSPCLLYDPVLKSDPLFFKKKRLFPKSFNIHRSVRRFNTVRKSFRL